MGTVCAPVSPKDSRSKLFIGTNVILLGSPTGTVPGYAAPPASGTPWIDGTCPVCVRRSVLAVVAQLIPILPWLPSWRSWICPVPSSNAWVGNPASVPSAFWIWGITWKKDRWFLEQDHEQNTSCILKVFLLLSFFFFFYLILNS